MTAFTILATNCSPTWMSCGFSCDCVLYWGSRNENAGSLPCLASAKKWSTVTRLVVNPARRRERPPRHDHTIRAPAEIP